MVFALRFGQSTFHIRGNHGERLPFVSVGLKGEVAVGGIVFLFEPNLVVSAEEGENE
jgi:hypothetical protein